VTILYKKIEEKRMKGHQLQQKTTCSVDWSKPGADIADGTQSQPKKAQCRHRGTFFYYRPKLEPKIL